MLSKTRFAAKICVLVILMLASNSAVQCQAALVYGTTATLTGSRSGIGELVTFGNYTNISVSWNISAISGGYHYEYQLDGFSQTALSHVIIDLTDNAVLPSIDPHAVTNANGEAILGTFSSSVGNSNPFLPAPIVGVKLNFGGTGPFVYSFDSNRAPVWGDFYTKGGNPPNDNSGYAYNVGITLHDTSENVNEFIARPDGTVVVPEASSFACMTLVGLGTVGNWARRRWMHASNG